MLKGVARTVIDRANLKNLRSAGLPIASFCEKEGRSEECYYPGRRPAFKSYSEDVRLRTSQDKTVQSSRTYDHHGRSGDGLTRSADFSNPEASPLLSFAGNPRQRNCSSSGLELTRLHNGIIRDPSRISEAWRAG
jgi:hypothetical protein